MKSQKESIHWEYDDLIRKHAQNGQFGQLKPSHGSNFTETQQNDCSENYWTKEKKARILIYPFNKWNNELKSHQDLGER